MQDILSQFAGQVPNLTLREAQFSSGSVGFKGFGKVTLNGKRYQVTGLNLVEIGSKPAETSSKK